MSSTYNVERFASSIDSTTVTKLEKFIHDFYSASDTPPPTSTPDPYLEYFTEDAYLKVALNEVIGLTRIQALRQGLWVRVKQMKHQVQDVAQLSATEFLWTGTVLYLLVNDKELLTEWSAYARFSDNSLTKMCFYHVYLDSSQSKAALAEQA
ncbi:uncharacterized protein KQ657_002960 [Scheffersomyces spartinae]|uniref:Uncharacterized protein n=1 Tax=Scheffersomyces spartinae TaxID=45513 RepID=A0A9P7V559_9ASCO|nr:uncharacterized protein KQ657_002960 [Scheffersomyces spartinae]KAG7191568.1 hypothetical protein KQ657_002960 [Scheffersomyces spartinae]